MPYVELHARSAFSFLRGGSLPEELASAADVQGMSALAICDRNGVYGAPRLHGEFKKMGRRALVGSELTMEDGTVLPLLVTNRKAYQNLCRLITRAQLRAPKGESRVLWSELPEFQEGLIALTGDEEGPLAPALVSNDRNQAEEVMKKLLRIFGSKNLFVEIQRHHSRGEERMVSGLRQLASSHGLKLLATNGVLYATPSGSEVLDLFTCLRHHTHLDLAGSLLSLNRERYLKSPAQMACLFRDIPEAITHTEQVADRLEFTLRDLGYHFPSFPVREGENMDWALRRETYAAIRERKIKNADSKFCSQLDKELRLIAELGFSGYFLIVQDIVRFARAHDILVQGRGSAANSAVCYCLGMTAINPVKEKLLFERFLSEGRTSWPDIDLDLPSGDRREKVIQEVFSRYGKHGAAMTANVITYRGRSAMREIGKALNFPEEYLKRFSDLFANGDFHHTIEVTDQMMKAGLPRQHPRLPAALRLYNRIQGLPRHLGQHSGGMVICQGRLDQVVPLENASMPGRVVTQWDKDDCADLGIIKVDLLGLGMMSVIQDTLKLSEERGRPVDFDNLNKKDAPTYELMQRADTVGVFQIESRAQMATLPRMKPKIFYDVVIEVSIIRPGPIVGDLAHPYLARRAGKEPIDYIHPELEDTLSRTLGVPLFQEQMLKMAMVMADFTGSEAEELRRSLGYKRNDQRLNRVLANMREKMTRKGVAPSVQEKIIKAAGSFALYGFPESHAISFGLLAYASCWFKVHRAPEFYCALLNNQPMGFYSPDTLVKDAKRRGLKFKPVCVLHSEVVCIIEADDSVRLGLNYVKGLQRQSAERIVMERKLKSFASLSDLLHRCALAKDERRILAEVGAFNVWSHHRRAALWEVEGRLDTGDLFANLPAKEAVPLLAMTPVERLESDYNGTSLTLGPNPMALRRAVLPHITRASDLVHLRHGQSVTIAGMVICRQRPGTAKGHVFISLEDETGISNAFVRSDLFERLRLIITHESYLEIEGTLQSWEDVVSVMAKDIRALDSPASVSAPSHDFH